MDFIFSGINVTDELHISIYFWRSSEKIKCLKFPFYGRQQTQISSKLSFEKFTKRSRPIRTHFLIWRVNEADRGWLRDLRSHTDSFVLRDRRIYGSTISKWQEPSKPLVNLLEERLQESSWLPRPPERAPQPLEEWRNLIVTDQEQSLFERSEDTRSRPNCWSENSPSSVWSVRSPRTSRLTCDSNLQPSLLSKKPQKPTWSVSSKTPTCAPSTPRGWPSCQRTSNWPEESVENELKS